MYQDLTLIGRIGTINSAATSTGMQVLNVSLATSKSIKDKQSGEFRDETEWHRLVMFGKVAEGLAQKLQTGDLYLFKNCELRTREWEKEGQKHFTTEVVVNDFPKKLPRYFTQQGGVDQQQSYQQPAQPAQQPQRQPQRQAQPQQQSRQSQQGYNNQPQQQYRQPHSNGMDMPDF